MQLLPLATHLDAAAIASLAERRLRESPYFFLRQLRCQCERGVLTLEGRVPLDKLRAFAEAIVLRVEGVREVINRVEVIDPQRVAFSGPAVRNAG